MEAKRLNDDSLVEVPELQHGVLQRGGNSLFNRNSAGDSKQKSSKS